MNFASIYNEPNQNFYLAESARWPPMFLIGVLAYPDGFIIGIYHNGDYGKGSLGLDRLRRIKSVYAGRATFQHTIARPLT